MTDIHVAPLVTCLEQVEVPRIDWAKRHELLDDAGAQCAGDDLWDR